MNKIELNCIYLWQWKNLQQCMFFIINEYPVGENWKTFLNLFEASGSPWLTEKQQKLLTSLLDMFSLTSLTVNPRRFTDVWSIPKRTAQLLDRKVSLPALTSTLILVMVMVSTKTNCPLFYQHSHIACEFHFLMCNKFSSPFNRKMRWFPFITWIYCKCP